LAAVGTWGRGDYTAKRSSLFIDYTSGKRLR
jgi:hypothetical protein